jgi:predicted nucleic-acid-binding Zn-ribbon protein
MKNSGACPKCSGRELYIISPVRHRVVGSLLVSASPVIATNLDGHRETVEAGTHELWICAACGFEEWYAQNFKDMLDTMLSIPEAGVQKKGEPGEGYR